MRVPVVEGSQFGPALLAADEQLERAVGFDLHVVAEQVGFGNVAERLVQDRLRRRAIGGEPARALDGDVEEARLAALAPDAIDRFAVDPGLLVDAVGVVAAELAERAAKGVDHRILGVLRLQREIVGLPQVLREIAEAVDPLQRGGRVLVLEHPLSRRLQPVAEMLPGGHQPGIARKIAVGHRLSPRFAFATGQPAAIVLSNGIGREDNAG